MKELPNEYWVYNPFTEPDKEKFRDVFAIMILGTSNGNVSADYPYYKIRKGSYVNHKEKKPEDGLPMLSFEEWKAAITEVPQSQTQDTSEEKYKIGDWVTTTRFEDNYIDSNTPLPPSQSTIGFTYQIVDILDSCPKWYRRTKGGTDGVMAISLRYATPEEIEKASISQVNEKYGTVWTPVPAPMSQDVWKVGDIVERLPGDGYQYSVDIKPGTRGVIKHLSKLLKRRDGTYVNGAMIKWDNGDEYNCLPENFKVVSTSNNQSSTIKTDNYVNNKPSSSRSNDSGQGPEQIILSGNPEDPAFERGKRKSGFTGPCGGESFAIVRGHKGNGKVLKSSEESSYLYS